MVDSREPAGVLRDGTLVEGPDALDWLQGQLTQDVSDLALRETRHSLLLTPQGKVASFCRVTRTGADSYLLDVERGHGQALFDRLKRFKLRVKVTLEQVTVRAEARPERGWDALGAPEIVAGEPAGEAVDAEGEGEFERILAGVPRLGRELTDKTIPQEAGEALVSRAVSFKKGCYTGQELVARLDARGANVPRQLRILRGIATDDGVPPPPGSSLEVDREPAGEVTSAAIGSDGSWAGLALVKRAALSPDEREVLVVTPDDRRLPATMLGPRGASA